MMKMEMTKHAVVDRIDRCVYIAQKIGFGDKIVCEYFQASRDRTTRRCLTETGIIIVKPANEEKMITAFIPDLDQAELVFKANGMHLPMWLANKVKKNQKYIKGCPV